MADRKRDLVRRALGAVGGVDLLVLLSILVVVGGVWGFLLLAEQVSGGESARIDESILLAFRNPDDPGDAVGSHEIEELVRDLTGLGGVAVIGLVTLSAIGFLLIDGKYHAAILVFIATVGGQLISSWLKDLYDRPRPEVVPHLMHASTASFPSGHSLMAAVTYLTLGALLARLIPKPAHKVFIIVTAVSITAMVGVSRVYLGVHYPTDVLAGWTAGLIWAVLCWEAARWLQRRGMVEPSDDP